MHSTRFAQPITSSVRARLESVEERAHIATNLVVEGVDELPVAIEEAFYRVALEALNNALRHARARRVDVTPVSYTHLDVYKRQGQHRLLRDRR